ncbi:hypothetical protein GH714_036956 [Hevea brasiliensis]|uniref:Uncharacterized protein n=1 Tax=Hevea brasiliensis TaxID=3981 RepID=A0A6A6M4H7_HEVBR|nr:hypothetical protein GH714_036956 [Hevea brasiliensis]
MNQGIEDKGIHSEHTAYSSLGQSQLGEDVERNDINDLELNFDVNSTLSNRSTVEDGPQPGMWFSSVDNLYEFYKTTCQVTKIISEHDHDMDPLMSRFMVGHRKITPNMKRVLEAHICGIRPCNSIRMLEVQAGGPENLSCMPKDCRNFIQSKRRLCLEESDAEAIQRAAYEEFHNVGMLRNTITSSHHVEGDNIDGQGTTILNPQVEYETIQRHVGDRVSQAVEEYEFNNTELFNLDHQHEGVHNIEYFSQNMVLPGGDSIIEYIWLG